MKTKKKLYKVKTVNGRYLLHFDQNKNQRTADDPCNERQFLIKRIIGSL